MKLFSQEKGICYKKTVRFFCMVVFLFFILVFTSVNAGLSTSFAKETGKIKLLSLERELNLESVTFSEILSGFDFDSLAVDLHSLDVKSLKGRTNRLNIPFATKAISRTISSLWRIRIPASVSLNSVDVDYKVVSCSGKVNYLSHHEQPGSEIRISVEPTAPTIVAREEKKIPVEVQPTPETPESEDPTTEEEGEEEPVLETPSKTSKIPGKNVHVKRTIVVEGGVVLRLYPDQIHYAGSYCGTLIVTISKR